MEAVAVADVDVARRRRAAHRPGLAHLQIGGGHRHRRPFVGPGDGHRDRRRQTVGVTVVGRHLEVELGLDTLAQRRRVGAGGEAVFAGAGIDGEGAVFVAYRRADIVAGGIDQMEGMLVVGIDVACRRRAAHRPGLAHRQNTGVDRHCRAFVGASDGNADLVTVAAAMAVGNGDGKAVGNALAQAKVLGVGIALEFIGAGGGIEGDDAVFGLHHLDGVAIDHHRLHRMVDAAAQMEGGSVAGVGILGGELTIHPLVFGLGDGGRRGQSRGGVGLGHRHRLGRGAAVTVGHLDLEGGGIVALPAIGRNEGVVAGGIDRHHAVAKMKRTVRPGSGQRIAQRVAFDIAGPDAA